MRRRTAARLLLLDQEIEFAAPVLEDHFVDLDGNHFGPNRCRIPDLDDCFWPALLAMVATFVPTVPLRRNGAEADRPLARGLSPVTRGGLIGGTDFPIRPGRRNPCGRRHPGRAFQHEGEQRAGPAPAMLSALRSGARGYFGDEGRSRQVKDEHGGQCRPRLDQAVASRIRLPGAAIVDVQDQVAFEPARWRDLRPGVSAFPREKVGGPT